MKVLLVAATTPAFKRAFANSSNLPNGLLFIGAMLEKHGHEVMVYDGFMDDRTTEELAAFKPDLIGFSVIVGPNMEGAIHMSKEFRNLLPNARIVWGNVSPSVLTEQTLAEDYVDYAVIGAGEYTMAELADHLQTGTPKIEEIKGLAFKLGGKVVKNEPRFLTKNMDELPDPAWHLVDAAKYRELDLNTSRGCAFHCAFCYNDSFNKGSLGYLSAERLVSQIEHLQQTYGAKHIRFNDDNFTFNRKRLRDFCRLLKEKKIKLTWSCDCRADLSEEDAVMMAKSGCVSVTLGFETGSQRMLDFVQKGITVDQMVKTFWLLVKYKIRASLYIMHGFPTETTEDFMATHRLLERLDRPYYLYNRFRPLPGTKLFDYCVDHKLITPPQKLGEWPEYMMQYSNKINLSEVPDELINNALTHYLNTYAVNRFRFTLKHDPAYFKIIVTNPKKFFRELWSLIKNQIYVVKSKRHLAGFAASLKEAHTKLAPKPA
ncbi:B12-binding domain-containing radical SAM protein [Dehalogenimonas etheniformans]|uniref:Radical SAM protein n=1 Tax=Dehalogenimonas etheniformans TaxID=1536648 RepID=A0A2P5P8I0_9CHLR|nr:radical SAM protein [Dehalogenimonas etheniformans]PPD58585.1 radical SAM protein [Dehalogenimonas etheniformans]QNT76651.1 B12-binding domain-containing radical SAM protein [Dehalogenimonas etheniformans]